MSQLRAAGAVAAALGALAVLTAACGSDGHPSPPSGAAGATASGKGGAAGEPPLFGFGGSSTSAAGSGVTMDPVVECAGVLVEAKSTPFDMYVMLDISDSMLGATEGDPTQSKWAAVRSALADFVTDDASDGIGVGLQVFPLRDPAVPDECTTNTECGALPCLTKACWPPGDDGLLYLCATSSGCGGKNCVNWGLCANDQDYACNRDAGPACGGGLGACEVQQVGLCQATADCRPERYAEPAAPIAELPAAQAGLLAVLATAQPEGMTPTGPALQGAIDQASSWAQAHADHQVVAVLATDGAPTLEQNGSACMLTGETPGKVPIDIATAGFAATPSIATFVIGVFGSLDNGPATAHEIALAGGTTQAFIVDTAGDVAMQFRQALNAIRASRLSCELLVPESENGEELNYMRVNVMLDDGSGSKPTPIAYVSNATGCQDDKLNWYYDVDPEPPVSGTPTRIVACPATCAAFGQVETGSVAIKLGCATKTQVVK